MTMSDHPRTAAVPLSQRPSGRPAELEVHS